MADDVLALADPVAEALAVRALAGLGAEASVEIYGRAICDAPFIVSSSPENKGHHLPDGSHR